MDPRVSTYSWLEKSSKAEGILARSKIHINMDKLRPHVIGASKDSLVYRFMKNASMGKGFITTKYDSITKKTGRLFTKKGELNLITLSDEHVLAAMDSRYEDGYIVSLDYKAFEPTIIAAILKDDEMLDLHNTTSSFFDNVDKNVIKIKNMELLYCDDFATKMGEVAKKLLNEDTCTESEIISYIDFMSGIRTKIDSYVKECHLDTYRKKGYVITPDGRKIFPNREGVIFNNVVQTMGSNILVDVIVELDKYIESYTTETHLCFHRFDAVYFDMSKKALYKHLKGIINRMENIRDGINLRVGVKIGRSLVSLKEL